MYASRARGLVFNSADYQRMAFPHASWKFRARLGVPAASPSTILESGATDHLKIVAVRFSDNEMIEFQCRLMGRKSQSKTPRAYDIDFDNFYLKIPGTLALGSQGSKGPL